MRKPRIGRLAAVLVGAVGLCALVVPMTPAQAQVPYIGVDFGNGFGVGIGAPPSAYGMVPASPIYPFYVPYYYPPRPYYYRYW